MAYTTPATGRLPGPARLAAVRRAGARISGLFWAVIRASQYGQMTRVLASMPDDVLKEIGISRSDIPDYARSLIDKG